MQGAFASFLWFARWLRDHQVLGIHSPILRRAALFAYKTANWPAEGGPWSDPALIRRSQHQNSDCACPSPHETRCKAANLTCVELTLERPTSVCPEPLPVSSPSNWLFSAKGTRNPEALTRFVRALSHSASVICNRGRTCPSPTKKNPCIIILPRLVYITCSQPFRLTPTWPCIVRRSHAEISAFPPSSKIIMQVPRTDWSC